MRDVGNIPGASRRRWRLRQNYARFGGDRDGEWQSATCEHPVARAKTNRRFSGQYNIYMSTQLNGRLSQRRPT